MRISELSRRSGVPLATIKFYLREGILPAGRTISATLADYDEPHLQRLALIRALIDLAAVPVARVKEILALVDAPVAGPHETLGRAVAALPPYAAVPESAEAGAEADYPLAKAAIESLGWVWDPRFRAVAQLEQALQAVSAAGIPMTSKRLKTYGRALHDIAEREISLGPDDPTAFLAYAVLGTALYEPVLLALRRLAHQDVSTRRFQA